MKSRRRLAVDQNVQIGRCCRRSRFFTPPRLEEDGQLTQARGSRAVPNEAALARAQPTIVAASAGGICICCCLAERVSRLPWQAEVWPRRPLERPSGGLEACPYFSSTSTLHHVRPCPREHLGYPVRFPPNVCKASGCGRSGMACLVARHAVPCCWRLGSHFVGYIPYRALHNTTRCLKALMYVCTFFLPSCGRHGYWEK